MANANRTWQVVFVVVAIISMGRSGWGATQIADYYPLKVGSVWEYRVAKQSVLAHGNDRRVSPKPGKVTETIVNHSPLRSAQHAVVVVRRRVEERNSTMPSPTVIEMDHHLSSDESGVLQHALVPTNQQPAAAAAPQPLLVEPARKGMVSQQAGPLEIRSSIVSQTKGPVAVGPRNYPDCIRVVQKGTASGDLGGAAAKGTVEETTWFAKGVGIVKVVRVMRLNLTAPQGETATVEETMTRELERYSAGPEK